MSHAFPNAQSISFITLRDIAPQLLNHAYLTSLVPSNVSWGLRSSGMFGCLPTFRYNLSVAPSKAKRSKTRHIGCPEMSVNNYQHTLRNNLEDRRPPLHDGGNLKSHITQAPCLLSASGKSEWRLSCFFPCLLPVWISKSWRVHFGSDTTIKHISGCHRHPSLYRGADKSLARPTTRCILFDGENIYFDASLVIYINSTNIPLIMIINRIYETQNLLSL
jgi:hypothetical protein